MLSCTTWKHNRKQNNIDVEKKTHVFEQCHIFFLRAPLKGKQKLTPYILTYYWGFAPRIYIIHCIIINEKKRRNKDDVAITWWQNRKLGRNCRFLRYFLLPLPAALASSKNLRLKKNNLRVTTNCFPILSFFVIIIISFYCYIWNGFSLIYNIRDILFIFRRYQI